MKDDTVFMIISVSRDTSNGPLFLGPSTLIAMEPSAVPLWAEPVCDIGSLQLEDPDGAEMHELRRMVATSTSTRERSRAFRSFVTS